LEEIVGIFDGLEGGLLGAVETQLLPGLISKALAQTNLGSLQGLLDKLRQSGLGPQVASWLGSGPNQPITAEQLENALGDGVVENVSSALNMPPDQIFGFLAKHLPAVIDALSPHGELKPS
jgi:uncharacterized protein YidB (DUF937 family)